MLDTLRNFAEVGIAIAGFSGIAAALNRQLDLAPGGGDRTSLFILLETAGLVVLFSLLPQVLSESRLFEVSLWRVSLLAYALLHLGHALLLRRRRILAVGIGPPVYRPLVYGGGFVLVLQFAVGFTAGNEALRLTYLAALCWHVVVAGVSFALLVTSGSRGAAA